MKQRKYDINTIEELERRMESGKCAMKDDVPRDGKSRYFIITSRYNSNLTIEPSVGKAFVEKHKADYSLLVIQYGANTDVLLLMNKNK